MKASELKKGMIINDEGALWRVIEMEHNPSGRGRAVYQSVLKDILSGKVINKRFNPTDAVEKADLDSKKVQYLYKDHAGYHFMDNDTYESITLDTDLVGQAKDYLKENLEVEALYHDHRPVSIELPVSIAFKIIESAPGTRGDTSGRALKPATLETGLVINVPLFIDEGETVLVDTRSGDYLGRA